MGDAVQVSTEPWMPPCALVTVLKLTPSDIWPVHRLKVPTPARSCTSPPKVCPPGA